jgi:hypothetical protein
MWRGRFSIGAVGVQIFKKHWTFAKLLCDIRGLGVINQRKVIRVAFLLFGFGGVLGQFYLWNIGKNFV